MALEGMNTSIPSGDHRNTMYDDKYSKLPVPSGGNNCNEYSMKRCEDDIGHCLYDGDDG